jgi:hypothetical protein
MIQNEYTRACDVIDASPYTCIASVCPAQKYIFKIEREYVRGNVCSRMYSNVISEDTSLSFPRSLHRLATGRPHHTGECVCHGLFCSRGGWSSHVEGMRCSVPPFKPRLFALSVVEDSVCCCAACGTPFFPRTNTPFFHQPYNVPVGRFSLF